MATKVITDPYVLVNAVDLSAYIKEARLEYDADALDASAGGDTTREYLPGLKGWRVTLGLQQDMAAAAVDATLFPLVGAAPFALEVRETKTGGRTVNNPGFTGNALLPTYSPLSMRHGQIHETSVTLQGTGTLTRATA
jgi:hypothetical protein